MIAHYGYQDSSGEYFITIDTAKCVLCSEKPCVKACPKGVFIVSEDDYGDKIVMVKDEERRKLKYVCSECKPVSNRKPLPCVDSCPYNSLQHSW